jgi:hypothetical protein
LVYVRNIITYNHQDSLLSRRIRHAIKHVSCVQHIFH